MFQVITIGAATLDVFFRSMTLEVSGEGDNRKLSLPWNSKLEADDVTISSGGAATNVAAGLARLGFQTGCVAEIGMDFAGQVILRDLEREGVDYTLLIQEKSEETGISGLLIAKDGSRTALVHRGAARMLTVEDLPGRAFETNWIHLSSVGNQEVITEIFAKAKEKGTRLSWNPGNWEIEQLHAGVFKPDWSAVTLFLVNKEEMTALSGTEFTGTQPFVGPQTTVVTNGSEGGWYSTPTGWTSFASESVESVQETGAGDAFATGCIAGMLMNKNIDQSIEFGKKEASSVIRSMGAKTGLLRQME
jgi:ribokinase